MEDFKKIEDRIYYAKYCDSKTAYSDKIWNSIKNNKELLKWAIKPTKDKFGEKDTVNAVSICENILIDYDEVDSEIYQRLINLIYSNRQIARIVLDGASNGGYSYLLMSLWNPKLKLTEDQKAFAIDEAMNKIGTVRYENFMNEYSKQLDEKCITDEQNMYIEFGNSVNPVGAKTGNIYMASVFNSFSDTQAHGVGDFDIRYWILKNPNWSLSEKQKLIMEFWSKDEAYDEALDQWEWNVVNDYSNYKEDNLPLFDKEELFECSYDILLKFYGDKETTDRIWSEITFCREMRKLRPQMWEQKFQKIKVL